jgi:hypothetical protein
VFTVIETPIFQKYAADIWSDDERVSPKAIIDINEDGKKPQ